MSTPTETAERVLTELPECYARIRELEAALKPFAALADEIEFCAGPNGNPSDWAMACRWPELVAARNAIKNAAV